MPLQPIKPDDARIEHKTAVLNGYTYHYLYGVPPGCQYEATVFLIHGWPDLSFGWRYQITLLLDMGFRVVAPDLIGFGGTDAPKVPPNPINLYSLKRASDDIAELAKHVGAERIILGGHDWGGLVVWRTAQWYPELISHIISACTPYIAPEETYISLSDVVKGPLPQFGYQIHFASGEVEKSVKDEQSTRQFLNGLFGARGPNGEVAFDPYKSLLVENLPVIGESQLMNGEHEYRHLTTMLENILAMEFMARYRTRRVNWEEDQALLDKKAISILSLFVQATYDSVLNPEIFESMEKLVPNLTKGEVAASH